MQVGYAVANYTGRGIGSLNVDAKSAATCPASAALPAIAAGVARAAWLQPFAPTLATATPSPGAAVSAKDGGDGILLHLRFGILPYKNANSLTPVPSITPIAAIGANARTAGSLPSIASLPSWTTNNGVDGILFYQWGCVAGDRNALGRPAVCPVTPCYSRIARESSCALVTLAAAQIANGVVGQGRRGILNRDPNDAVFDSGSSQPAS
jgi:hypothetical protein